MNAITTTPTMSDDQLVEVMRNSLYPGACRESVEMAMGYCRARRLDPMLKPVHIVPMYVKHPNGNGGEMRDVVMPGIGLYRIDAARTGSYAGKSEPVFGPLVKLTLDGKTYTVPEWCKVTVSRVVHGQICSWTACEYWIENYATAGRNSEAPNAMWAKRARGQLAKCAEAQALRMAFPEAIGDHVTAEEMEGKTFAPEMPPAAGPTIQGQAERAPPPADLIALNSKGQQIAFPDAESWLRYCRNKALDAMQSADAVRAWMQAMEQHIAEAPADAQARLHDAAAARVDALTPTMDHDAEGSA